MRKRLKRVSFIFVIFYMISLMINIFTSVSAAGEEYRAYIKELDREPCIYIEDPGVGSEKISYCYNQTLKYPENFDSQYKVYYTRQEGYLNSNDPLTDEYGEVAKQKIATVLKYGYPLNATDLMSRYYDYLTDGQFMKVTQELIWAITFKDYRELDPYSPDGNYYEALYYNELLKLAETNKFQQVNLKLVGNLKFTNKGSYYSTDRLIIDSTDNVEGEVIITNLPSNMTVKKWGTGEVLDGKPIAFRTEFYIESKTQPDTSFKLRFNYKFSELKFYFYKHSRGGEATKKYQSLIRAELSDTKLEEPFEVGSDNIIKPIETGGVILNKKDSQSKGVLSGAVFKLQDSTGVDIKTGITTDINGQIRVDNLPLGSYKFIETQAPTGYKLDNTPINFTITSGQTAALQVEKLNVAIPGSVILTKKDSQSKSPLKGAVFKVQDSTGKDIQVGLTTDINGQIRVDNLAPGSYKFIETKAPDGYKIDTTPLVFNIIIGQTVPLTIEKTNTAIPGSVVLTKKDSQTNNVLQGAIFKLQDSAGVDIKTGLTTDGSGQIRVDNLAPGNYKFIETQAPAGYKLDSTPLNFTIAIGQTTDLQVEKFNDPKSVDFKITKVEKGSGNLLKGAEFELASATNPTVPLKFTYSSVSKKYERNDAGSSKLSVADADSSFTIGNLECGDYILKETKSPSGYKKGKDIYIHISVNQSYYKIGEDGVNVSLSKDTSLNLYQLKVENEKGFILPGTGGSGVNNIYKVSIGLLLLVSMAMFIYYILILKKDGYEKWGKNH
ncbi:Cna protein B-type domain-containing protein [Clostridium collagenovorans DSM 3089]|uniref:Cna protein B-type domain-containing protein n=1 Tax=Clostridium collagenovorans DSM 3089 TaxID=1121306 RepID=A0A1M5WT90_9CLOT|nr:SpaA isopeptide-forming pilin-related protein [Clostridium collagenovorans]SHH90769.1 Cna protein B-type domain-containing protein [Clostridium collagenovorans DSM 3089]